MSSRPSMTLVPVGGLANRMKAIDAAIQLISGTDISLKIYWFRDQGLNCRFDQLFEPLNLPQVSLVEASAFDALIYDRPRKRNFYIPRLFQSFLFDDCVYGAEATERMYHHFDFRSWATSLLCSRRSMKRPVLSETDVWAYISDGQTISLPSKRVRQIYLSSGCTQWFSRIRMYVSMLLLIQMRRRTR